MKKCIAVLLTLLLVLLNCACLAEEDADALCDRGMSAANDGDYSTAFECFSQAAKLGSEATRASTAELTAGRKPSMLTQPT